MRTNTNISARTAFDRCAKTYDMARRSFTVDELESILLPFAHDGGSCLEIGAGTGQATVALSGMFTRVVALEPGAQMSDLLREKLAPSVQVVTTDFEEFTGDGLQFDSIVAFNSYQWIRQPQGDSLVASLLAPHGRLGLVWTYRWLTLDRDRLRFERVCEQEGLDHYSWLAAPEESCLRVSREGQDEVISRGSLDLRAMTLNRFQSVLASQDYISYLTSLANGEEFSVDQLMALERSLPRQVEVTDFAVASIYGKRSSGSFD